VPDRPLRTTILVLAAVASLAAACTGSSDGTVLGGSGTPATSASAAGATFSGNGVSFSYPRDWKAFGRTDTSASTGSQVWSHTVGVDGRNLVNVSAYSLSVPITSENIEARADGIRSQLDSLFAQAGGTLGSGPTRLEMGGLPALAFTGSARDPNGAPVEDRLVLAFDGTTEYFVNCQYDRRSKAEIGDGCDQVVSTFEVTG